MSLLDIDERLLALAQRVSVVWGPLVDAKEFPENVDVTLVEGAVSSEEDLHRIRLVRARTKILVTLGDCAVTGNVSAMRNNFGANARPEARLPGERHAGRADSAPGDSAAVGHRAPGPRIRAGGRVRARLPALRGPDLLGAQRTAGRQAAQPGREIRINYATAKNSDRPGDPHRGPLQDLAPSGRGRPRRGSLLPRHPVPRL